MFVKLNVAFELLFNKEETRTFTRTCRFGIDFYMQVSAGLQSSRGDYFVYWKPRSLAQGNFASQREPRVQPLVPTSSQTDLHRQLEAKELQS
jgi:hypothetical protein